MVCEPVPQYRWPVRCDDGSWNSETECSHPTGDICLLVCPQMCLSGLLIFQGWNWLTVVWLATLVGLRLREWLEQLKPPSPTAVNYNEFFKGKNILVTGATSGIGEALVVSLDAESSVASLKLSIRGTKRLP